MTKYQRKEPWCKVCGGRHPKAKSGLPFMRDMAPVACEMERLPNGNYTRKELAQRHELIS